MSLRLIATAVATAAAAYGLNHLVQSGLFHYPTIDLVKSKEIKVIYRMHTGNYANSGKAYNEVVNLAGMQVNFFSVFFEDPDKVIIYI